MLKVWEKFNVLPFIPPKSEWQGEIGWDCSMDPELLWQWLRGAGGMEEYWVMRNRAGNGKTFPDEDLVDRVKGYVKGLPLKKSSAKKEPNKH